MKKNGFTLVEMILYMGILSIFILVLNQLFIYALDYQLKARSPSLLIIDSRFILSRLTYDIQRADSIEMPAQLGEAESRLQLMIDGKSYRYLKNGADLQLAFNGQDLRLNSPDIKISDFNIKRIGNLGGKHGVKINMTFQSSVIKNRKPEEIVISTSVALR